MDSIMHRRAGIGTQPSEANVVQRNMLPTACNVRQVSSLKSQWAEILVAPRVEEVEGEPLVLEAHRRRGDRDAALALDRHPIRAHPPPLALTSPASCIGPAKQQQFLGQRGLPGVRMRNDRKGPPAQNLVPKDYSSIRFNIPGCCPFR